jgi:hypothetical protein
VIQDLCIKVWFWWPIAFDAEGQSEDEWMTAVVCQILHSKLHKSVYMIEAVDYCLKESDFSIYYKYYDTDVIKKAIEYH